MSNPSSSQASASASTSSSSTPVLSKSQKKRAQKKQREAGFDAAFKALGQVNPRRAKDLQLQGVRLQKNARKKFKEGLVKAKEASAIEAEDKRAPPSTARLESRRLIQLAKDRLEQGVDRLDSSHSVILNDRIPDRPSFTSMSHQVLARGNLIRK